MFEVGVNARLPVPSGSGTCCARNLYQACEHDEEFMRTLLADTRLERAAEDTPWGCGEDDAFAGENDLALLPAAPAATTPDAEQGPVGGWAAIDGGAAASASAAASAEMVAMIAEGQRTGLALASWLTQIELRDLEPYDLVEVIAAWTRVASWAQARAGEAAATLTEMLSDAVRTPVGVPTTTPDRRRWPRPGATVQAATAELAMRLATTKPRAQDLVETGGMLTGVLAETGSALERGDIDYSKAQIFARQLATVPVEIAQMVEDAVLPRAPRLTPTQLEREIARALLEVDPGNADNRHEDALRKRRVNHPRPLPEGMASIYAVLPAPHALALDQALDAAARTARAHGDGRTTDQLRADALSTMGTTALAAGQIAPHPGAACPGTAAAPDGVMSHGTAEDGQPPAGTADAAPEGWHEGSGTAFIAPPPLPPASGEHFPLGTLGGATPRISVTVSLETLLGGTDPADLEGYGPITATTARALAAGGVWRRLVTDPLTGTVTDVGRTRYRPPPGLAELVRARDGTCTRPGCNVRARSCEIDHTIPYGGSGHGTTSLHNLTALCASDHALKSSGHFRVQQDPDGRTRWTTPAGHIYTRSPDATTTHHTGQPPAGQLRRQQSAVIAGEDPDPPPPF